MTAYEVNYCTQKRLETIGFDKLKDAKEFIEQNTEKLGNCSLVMLVNYNTHKMTKVQFVTIHENGKIWTEVYKYKCIGTFKHL